MMTYRHYDPISRVMQRICRQHGIPFYPDLVKFAALWRKTMGPYILRNTEVRRFQKGVAWIRTPSPTWRFELTQMKSHLIDRLNHAAGHPFVRDLRIEIGAITSENAAPEPNPRNETEREVYSLPPDETAWVKRCVEDIQDPDLRRQSENILTRFLIRSLNPHHRS